ncbi:MAG: HAMP domain-containing sensor histidine kinase [Eubacteriales bacterium]|nr:HAMP domain-containing sensor histidine kinase [Eubacteriales bacterium]
MKLSWKLFFLTTPIFILFLTLFGSWVIQDSFQRSLQQEIRRCMAENQLFQNSYELTRHSLSQEQLEQISVEWLIESFHRHDGQSDLGMRIYNDSGEILYQDTGVQIPHGIRELLTEEKNTGYELVHWNEKTYLVVMGITSFQQYVETTADITGLFTDRSEMYARYQIGMLFVCLAAGCLILIVIFTVMKNVRILSGAVRRFAGGQYDVRASVNSHDEIGMLAVDFNWMADSMSIQMEKLQNEVERQEEFTSAFAHELKTPLTSIIGYADTLRQMDLSKEETDMCANYIFYQGKRLQSLSYKLLEMMMVGRQEIAQREISVPEFLQEAGKTVEPLLKENDIFLEIKAEKGVIYGDPDLLSTVFINFLDNARKASESGRHIRMTGCSNGSGYIITVEDEGRGIPAESLSRITEAFYMVDKSRARKEGGAGLGLALCRKILEMHKALWKIESEPGRGTKITVCFRTDQTVRRQRRKRRGKDVG